jgi:hypothetical protein
LSGIFVNEVRCAAIGNRAHLCRAVCCCAKEHAGLHCYDELEPVPIFHINFRVPAVHLRDHSPSSLYQPLCYWRESIYKKDGKGAALAIGVPLFFPEEQQGQPREIWNALSLSLLFALDENFRLDESIVRAVM